MNLTRASLPWLQLRGVPLIFSAAILIAGGLSAPAQGTKLWTQSRFDEFEKGTPQGIAIASDGKLRSGPVATEILTTPSSFVWSVAVDKAGVAYLATGSPATVLRVAPDGKSSKLFDTKALAVQVLRMGPDGMLYAATLPDGRVYRLKPDAASSVDESSAETIFDLGKIDLSKADDGSARTDARAADAKARYIWDMTFDSTGRLYVATGGPGIVYRLDVKTAGAKPEAFFKSDEQHIRALAWDGAGNLIAGSDGSGLVYRIDPAGKGYVLFSAPRREITAVTVGADGTIFASDVGDKSRNPLPPLPVQAGGGGITITFSQPGSVQVANASLSLPDGSEIYALKANEAPRKIWAGKDEIVYQLMAGADAVTALTGNRGRILQIHADSTYSDVAHLEAQQAVSLTPMPGGFLVGTSNTGKLFRLSDSTGRPADHAYASDVFDAGAFTRWGRVEAEAGSKGYTLSTRSGNVEQPVRSAKDWGWSEWQRVADDKIVSPAGRYLQWKVELAADGVVGGVGVNYLPVNAAPVVDEVMVTPGARVVPQPAQTGQPAQVALTFPSAAQNSVAVTDPNAANNTPIQAQKDRTAVTVRWAAHDDNGDDLSFDLYLRGDGEQAWRPLKKGLTDKVYSFDGNVLPDGGYLVKVVASDSPSHSPGEALSGEMVSERFELDTTAPVISGLKAEVSRPVQCVKTPCPPRLQVQVNFEAADAASAIAHAEYSLDAGPWQYIDPVGGLSDSKTERYSIAVPLQVDEAPGAAEHLITVRVYDRHDNAGVGKVVTPAGQK